MLLKAIELLKKVEINFAMSFIGKNIKKIRAVRKLSQAAFADLFNLARPSVGAYEEGRSEPKIDTIIAIANHFSLSTDALLRKELTVNELYSFDILKGEFDPTQMPPALGKSIRNGQKDTKTVTGNYEKGIPLVEKENALEYIVNLHNKDFIIDLKRIQLPAEVNGKLRAFVHSGDEMFYQERGLRDGDILLGAFVDVVPKKVKTETVYIIVTSRGFITRRIFSVEETNISLQADNSAYETKTVDKEEILEIWKIIGVWSNYISPPSMVESRLMSLENQVNQLNKRLSKLEGKAGAKS